MQLEVALPGSEDSGTGPSRPNDTLVPRMLSLFGAAMPAIRTQVQQNAW